MYVFEIALDIFREPNSFPRRWIVRIKLPIENKTKSNTLQYLGGDLINVLKEYVRANTTFGAK